MVTDTIIRKGYKQTEIGVIPEDWDVKKLGDISAIDSDNLEYSTNSDYAFKYISLEDVDCGILRNYTELIFKNAPSRARRKIQQGDVLISTVRPNLQSHLLIQNLGKNFICSTGFSVVRCKDGEASCGYVFNHFFSSIINKQINNLTTGSNYPAISSKDVNALLIPLPPTKSEQSAIATVLSDTAALIGHLEKMIAKKKAIKQGAMQQLLTGKKRLPEFNGKWEVKKIGDIATVGRGRVISHREMDPLIQGKYPVYSSQTSDNGIMGYINTFDFDGEYVTWTTDGERAGTVFYRDGKFNCTNVCGTIKFKKDNSRFIAMILGTITPKFVSRNLANPKLMNDPVKKIEIPLPNINEQAAIATILSDMDLEIEKLELKLEKYKMLKQGIMQQLLTGKIRLL